MTPERQPQARALAQLLGVFHNISYYAPEMKAFGDVGLPEYWRAYMAYRSAPMGIVPASVVQSTFYNFAPAVVDLAIPSAWASVTPAQAMELRDRCIDSALQRALDGIVTPAHASEASALALAGISECEAGARPLFAAHRELDVPDDPLMRLWHACTLWREHRGDGHNIALAAAAIDGIECHVLLAAKGVGNKDIIIKIRGWTDDEWQGATDRLLARRLITPNGEFTEAGRQLRSDIERQTDDLAEAPRVALGEDRCTRLIELMEPAVEQLVSSGAVPGRWPPTSSPATQR